MSNSKKISRLLFKYLQGTITTDEAIMLQEWRRQSPENEQLFSQLSGQASARFEAPPGAEHLEDKIFSKISSAIPELQKNVVPMHRFNWKYAAVAASVLIILGAGLIMQSNNTKKVSALATIEHTDTNDVDAPGANYASITLADGQTVNLNGSADGKLASQGRMEVVKTADGLIVYKAAAGQEGKTIQLNTLSNPKGSKVVGMVLEDGTKVWLNAGSSLTYPVAFVDNERSVSITGEAYFEVAKNKNKPFRVKRDNMQIEVLGTHFNVNAFTDDPNMKVTLLEGSVKVSSAKASGMLKPGQQAKVSNQDIRVQSDINLDQVMAWKNGYFSFEKASVAEVMGEIARWYNIDVVYAGQIPDEHFGGDLRRNSKLSSVLRVLEKSGVKFRIEGNKVTVYK